MDVFVLPSYANEGVPQAVLQAMSCGLPVVATPAGSIEEAVVHGQTGLIVPARDPEALAAALSGLLDDEPLRRRFARKAAASQSQVSKSKPCSTAWKTSSAGSPQRSWIRKNSVAPQLRQNSCEFSYGRPTVKRIGPSEGKSDGPWEALQAAVRLQNGSPCGGEGEP